MISRISIRLSVLMALAPAFGWASHLERAIELPSGTCDRFHHLAVDSAGRRLFAACPANGTVAVVDLRAGKLAGTIRGLVKPHTLTLLDRTHRAYVTDGGDGSVKAIDTNSFEVLGSIPLLPDADSGVYDGDRYLYVASGGRDSGHIPARLSEIDIRSGREIAASPSGSETLEGLVVDRRASRLLINIPSQNQVAVYSRPALSMIATWTLTKGEKNFVSALDEKGRRLFVACRSGGLVILNSDDGRELQDLPLVSGVDDIRFDPATKTVVASGDGSLDVFRPTSQGQYQRMAEETTGSDARTSTFSPALKRYLIAVPAHGNKAARILIFRPW